jgi:hypothetical protein
MMDSNVSSGLPDHLMMDSNVSSVLPDHLMMDSNEVKDKADIVGVFIKHFVSAGSVFDNGGAQDSNVNSVTVNYDIGPHVNHFIVESVSYTEVCKALKAIDTKKSAGPDNLDSYLLKIAAGIITEPAAHIFNLSLLTNSIPNIWKSASVLPLLKGGDPSDDISKLPILAKVYESLVISQLKNILIEKNILSGVQSGFTSGHNCSYGSGKLHH